MSQLGVGPDGSRGLPLAHEPDEWLDHVDLGAGVRGPDELVHELPAVLLGEEANPRKLTDDGVSDDLRSPVHIREPGKQMREHSQGLTAFFATLGKAHDEIAAVASAD